MVLNDFRRQSSLTAASTETWATPWWCPCLAPSQTPRSSTGSSATRRWSTSRPAGQQTTNKAKSLLDAVEMPLPLLHCCTSCLIGLHHFVKLELSRIFLNVLLRIDLFCVIDPSWMEISWAGRRRTGTWQVPTTDQRWKSSILIETSVPCQR